MLIFFLMSFSLASNCPLTTDRLWAHYADEWGHEENKVETLKSKDIRIGAAAGRWVYLPRTCTKHGCDVSFLLQLPKKNCWKPLVSVQGRVQPLKHNDWSRFRNTYLRSSVDVKKKNDQVWVFDPKDQAFRQSPSASVH